MINIVWPFLFTSGWFALTVFGTLIAYLCGAKMAQTYRGGYWPKESDEGLGLVFAVVALLLCVVGLR